MGRREFIILLGSAATWPLVGRAQQLSMPVIGFLGSGTPQGYTKFVASFRRGLGEVGYIQGQNVEIEFLWADGQYDRLPELAAELIRHRVSLIAAGALPAALAAKDATSVILVVFTMGSDAVKFGLVASLDRPGGNITGVGLLNNPLLVKQIEFLREVTPTAGSVAFLVNPHNPNVENDAMEAESAARSLGVKLLQLSVSSEPDLDAAFTTLAQRGAAAFFVNPDPFFTARPDKIAALATRHRIPGIHYLPEFTAAGGLASYVTDFVEGYRLAGTYVGRILKGEKPAGLPVQQFTKVALIINLKTAHALRLTIPLPLLGRADAVIE